MMPCLALVASVAFLVVSIAQAFVPLSTPMLRSAAADTALGPRGSYASPSAGDKDIVVSRQGFLGGVLSGACMCKANEEKTHLG